MTYILLLFFSLTACFSSDPKKDSEQTEEKKEKTETPKAKKKKPSILNIKNEWQHISWKYEDEELELSELNVRPWADLKDLDREGKKQVKRNYEVSINKIFTPNKALLSKADRQLLKSIPIQQFGQLLPPKKRNQTTNQKVEFHDKLKAMYLLCWEMKYTSFDSITEGVIPQKQNKKGEVQPLEVCEFWVFEKQLSTIKDKDLMNYYQLDVPFTSDFWTTYLTEKSDGLYEFRFDEWIQENSTAVKKEKIDGTKKEKIDSDTKNRNDSPATNEPDTTKNTPVSKPSSMSKDELCHKNKSDENKIVFQRSEEWAKLLKIDDKIVINSREQHIRYLKELSPESCSNAKMIVESLYSVLGCNPFKRPEDQKNCK